MAVEVIHSTTRQNALLEGPHWDPITQSLLYVEIYSGKVHRYMSSSDSVETVSVGEFVGAIVPSSSGKILIAGRRHFSYIDWHSGLLDRIVEVDIDKPDNRFNDGKCDPAGRFWAGTMGIEERPGQVKPKQGRVYSLHSDCSVTQRLDNISISNGMAWSPDHRTMYYIDSLEFRVDALDYDVTTGQISNRRQVVKIAPDEGFPDGMCTDAEGMIWVACFTKSVVNRYDPNTGAKIRSITFPVTNVTSCCFGGENYENLYVTSSSYKLTREQYKQQPLAGSIFVVKGLGVKGLPADVYHDK